MSEEYGYPLGDTEYRHDEPITENFVTKEFSEKDLSDYEFEFDAPDVSFIPRYYPDRVLVRKNRDIVREKGICRNEYVKDVGTENREVHVEGIVTAYKDSTISYEGYINNLQSFHDMCDFGQRGDIFTMQWQGEVLLENSDLEGPVGVDPQTGHFQYEYTLDFISTGASELGNATTGIVNDG